MTFSEWIDTARGDESRTQFLKALSKKAGVSLATLQLASRGGRVGLYQTASMISSATDGAVTIQELCM